MSVGNGDHSLKLVLQEAVLNNDLLEVDLSDSLLRDVTDSNLGMVELRFELKPPITTFRHSVSILLPTLNPYGALSLYRVLWMAWLGSGLSVDRVLQDRYEWLRLWLRSTTDKTEILTGKSVRAAWDQLVILLGSYQGFHNRNLSVEAAQWLVEVIHRMPIVHAFLILFLVQGLVPRLGVSTRHTHLNGSDHVPELPQIKCHTEHSEPKRFIMKHGKSHTDVTHIWDTALHLVLRRLN